MAVRFAHTNLIARDWRALSAFYQRAFGMAPVGAGRDLRGDWVDMLTGRPGAHIAGEHLALPGFPEGGPTLEIFGYDRTDASPKSIAREGFSHIAFAVDDVDQALARVLAEGGSRLGEVVAVRYPGGAVGTFVYALDPEGNAIELNTWRQE